jgi:AcrR family transcriptional regulator
MFATMCQAVDLLWQSERMPPSRRPVDPESPSVREGLMDAAIDQLTQKGVLAGLNLREVAEAVGVTPANIYYYFGDRQALLRAALARETDRLSERVVQSETEGVGFAERRLQMFDAIGANHRLALTALLALDGDPAYEPLPFLDATRSYYAELVADGRLAPGIDIEALHVLTLAAAIGISIYTDAAARQMGIAPEELRVRTRAAFAQVVDAIERTGT